MGEQDTGTRHGHAGKASDGGATNLAAAAKRPQLKVVHRVKRCSDGNIIIHKLEKLFLEEIYLCGMSVHNSRYMHRMEVENVGAHAVQRSRGRAAWRK